MKKDPNT